MAEITALKCVADGDVSSLRIICMKMGDKRKELEKTDYYGNTAFLKACFLGRLGAALLLLQFGANIRAVNYFGQNALTLATYSGCFKLISELLQRCSYSEFNKTTLTPAICVATFRKDWQLVNFYIAQDRNSAKDIQTAHGLNYKDIIRFLRIINMSRNPNCPKSHMHL